MSKRQEWKRQLEDQSLFTWSRQEVMTDGGGHDNQYILEIKMTDELEGVRHDVSGLPHFPSRLLTCVLSIELLQIF